MIFEIISALGGSIVFLAAIGGLLRGVFRQTAATEDNTRAIHEMSAKLETILTSLNNFDKRLTDLETWRKYAAIPSGRPSSS